MRDGTLSYGTDKVSKETGLSCKDPSLTVQDQKQDADINEIVRRFGLSGELPQAFRLPEFADYEDVFDFQSAQNALIAARESFLAIPADIRARFDNDPQKFLEFCSDGENLPELRKLGLAPEVAPAPVAPETPPVKP